MADQDSLSKLLEWGSGILSTAAFFFGGRAFQVHDNLGTRIGELEKANVTRAELDSDLHDLRIDLNRREDRMDDRFRELKDDLKEDIKQVLKGLDEIKRTKS